MGDRIEPIEQFSPQGGALALERVSGATSGRLNPENDVEVAQGRDRSMYVYVPRSGCPHPKQTQVLMVLRDGGDEGSAQALLDGLGLARLAEDEHFLVVFPNPLERGWNYRQDLDGEDDADFVVRCFAALPRSRGGVAGFNGMIYHLATSPETSAMVMALAIKRPLDAAAVMVGHLPAGYRLPEGTGAPQVAWVYDGDAQVGEYLAAVDGPATSFEAAPGVVGPASRDNACVRYFESERGLDAREVASAWALMFSGTRRWRNDTFGTYQERVRFDDLGFVAHRDDAGLGLADGLPRTWFEYVPPAVASSPVPAPLVIYLHGINCCGTYGAEQSRWDAIAARDGLMAVFPTATVEHRWNVWDDPRLPSDVDYVLALIEHMDGVHPVDRSRIYISGFSMGSMFANTLAATHPDVFAGAVALNGPAMGILQTLDESRDGMLALQPRSRLADLGPGGAERSPAREAADAWGQTAGHEVPFVQFVGLLDSVGMGDLHPWPVRSADDGLWPTTVAFWRGFDAVGSAALKDASMPTGLGSDGLAHAGRLWDQAFLDASGRDLYHLVACERMPHAVDLGEVEYGWDLVRRWSRGPHGELCRTE